MLTYGSVCSGIESASVAWAGLGLEPVWLAEIEPFPSAVLAHHYPDTPNLGDMTRLAGFVLSGKIEAPDVLIGGTPCQAFSVAGMREGLADPRGALTIKYVELADATDYVRARRNQPPCVLVWENVPGVLSDKGNAFGCFLGALAGENCELLPSGKKWPNAGCVYGPERTIAWRVLDAQYFGLAQRRRRVFVVASARNGFDPLTILFERDSLRRDTAPSREARPSSASATGGSAGTCGADEYSAVIPAGGCWWDGGQVSQTLDAVLDKGQTMPEKNRFPAVLQPITYPILEVGKRTGTSTDDPRAGLGVGSESDPMFTLQAGAQHGVFAFQATNYQTGAFEQSDVAGTLTTTSDRSRGAPLALTSVAHVDVCPTICAGGNDKGGDRPIGTNVDTAESLLSHGALVRRLTPRECERLQGFPDDYTLIPWRGKPAEACPDGPRYRAIGNSKAVPVVRWLGIRLMVAIQGSTRTNTEKNAGL